MRVTVEKGGCAGMSYKMEIAEPQPGDEVIESDGARVIVDAKAVLYLLGTKMEMKTTQFASTFVFENPNQTSACGCGESVELTPADPASERAALEASVHSRTIYLRLTLTVCFLGLDGKHIAFLQHRTSNFAARHYASWRLESVR